MGFSAGGHLAGTAATYFDKNFLEDLGITPDISLRPAFAAMIYPVISMINDSIVHKKSRRNLLTSDYSLDLAQMLSLENHVRPDMPPVFLVHCAGDRTVNYRNAVNYHKALKEKEVPHVFKLYNEPGHGFGINPPKGKRRKEATLWIHTFITWLEETT